MANQTLILNVSDEMKLDDVRQELCGLECGEELCSSSTEHNPERGVLANADVNVAGIMTICNVKIKQDDYGLTVTMPRTKMPHTEQYKDSVYFADKSMKQQFDRAVETAYQESILAPVLEQGEPEEGMEQEEDAGMSMGMQ